MGAKDQRRDPQPLAFTQEDELMRSGTYFSMTNPPGGQGGMQIQVWVHVSWLVSGAGYRNDVTGKGVRAKEDHVGFGAGVLRTGPAPAGHWSVNRRSKSIHSYLQC